MSFLSNFINTLNLQIPPGEQWSSVGPEVDGFTSKLKIDSPKLHPFSELTLSNLDGLLLAGTLSSKPDSQPWLTQIATAMKSDARLIIIDWQTDGPLHVGPDLSMRVSKGRVCRLLRESGFGLIDLLENQPMVYAIQAQKSVPPQHPRAGEFVDVAGLDELPKNSMKVVELFGQKIIIANTGREIVAFAQICPHSNTMLNKGLLRGRNVVCPLHGYIWNVRSGEPVMPEDQDILPRYPVKVDQDSGRVFVALE